MFIWLIALLNCSTFSWEKKNLADLRHKQIAKWLETKMQEREASRCGPWIRDGINPILGNDRSRQLRELAAFIACVEVWIIHTTMSFLENALQKRKMDSQRSTPDSGKVQLWFLTKPFRIYVVRRNPAISYPPLQKTNLIPALFNEKIPKSSDSLSNSPPQKINIVLLFVHKKCPPLKNLISKPVRSP